MGKMIVEWRQASPWRDPLEPFTLVLAQQEKLLGLLSFWATDKARESFGIAARHTQSWQEFKKEIKLLQEIVIPFQAVELWHRVTENVRFEARGVLPFGRDVSFEMLGDELAYRAALDRDIERRVQVAIAPFAEIIAVERKQRQISEEMELSFGAAAGSIGAPSTASTALLNNSQSAADPERERRQSGSDPQPPAPSASSSPTSFNRLAREIEILSGELYTYLGDPVDTEEMAYKNRELARNLEEFLPKARAANQIAALQSVSSDKASRALPGETFGGFLSRQMKDLGLTDGKVADTSGIARQHVARLRKTACFKRGPSADTLKALANATGIDLAELTRLAGAKPR
jgi:hypothetical protein